MPIDVVHFHSGQNGAPTLNGVAGSYIALLDAVLVNGWGVLTASSCVIASGICTITLPSSPSTPVNHVALIAGAAVSAVNGRQRVTATTSNTISFPVAASDGSVSGTITVKVAPAGWSKVYSGTNLAAYKPTDPSATGFYLYVDDTAAQNARVRGYESMSGISSGLVGPFPTDAQMSGGLYWPKSSSADATARGWSIYADHRCFYVASRDSGNAPQQARTFAFGDMGNYKPADPYCCFIAGMTTSTSWTDTTAQGGDLGTSKKSGSQVGTYMARASNGVGGSNYVYPISSTHTTNTSSDWMGRTGAAYTKYPDPVDNSLHLGVHRLIELDSTAAFAGYRAFCPGLWHPDCVINQALGDLADLPGSGPLTGRTLRSVLTGPGQSATGATIFFDITGPWR